MDLVVDMHSATLDGYNKLAWDRTHDRMNKFSGPKDVRYTELAGKLKEFAKKSFKLMKTRQHSEEESSKLTVLADEWQRDDSTFIPIVELRGF